jgi:hypothetical protein
MTSTELDAAAEAEAKAFRPKASPIAIAALANCVLAALCLGVPYYRGHVHARDSVRAFSRFAGCLLAAQPEAEPGLGLPPGERDHFAAQVLRAGADWPARCKSSLRAIAPPDAIFLWPSVKQAGGDVRAVMALVEQELSALARKRQMDEAGVIPARPLLALSKLRAALALFASSAGLGAEVDANAVRFDKAAAVAPPARLPLMAGANALLDVWAGLDGLRATAMDSRGLSSLRVADGKIDRRRVKRTNLVRAALRFESGSFVVWAMARDRCADTDDRCAHRATGIASFDADADALPAPRWLSGHPAARVDRSVRAWLRTTVELLSLRDASGAIEVRRFELPPQAEPGAAPEQDAPPLAPKKRFGLGDAVPSSAALVRPGAAAYTLPEGDGHHAWLALYDSEPAVPALDLGRVAGDAGWVAACAGPSAQWIAFGTRGALSIARVAPEGGDPLVATPLKSTTVLEAKLALGDPIHESDPARDRLRMWCDDASATAVGLTAAGGLVALRCDATHCEQSPELAKDVASFDAKPAADGAVLLAFSQKAKPQVVAARLPRGARALEAVQTPAACWEREGGMCGQPTLVADSGRILLCAREDTDLLALESEDAGKHWKPMSGLQIGGPAPSDVNDAMKQHRLRKGLD